MTLLTTSEAAAHTGIKRTVVSDAVRHGRIPAVRRGRKAMVTEEDLLVWSFTRPLSDDDFTAEWCFFTEQAGMSQEEAAKRISDGYGYSTPWYVYRRARRLGLIAEVAA